MTEEHVLAFPTRLLGDKPPQGFTTNLAITELACVHDGHKEANWLPRSEADANPEYKQPIVYAYITRTVYGVRQYLVYERGGKGGEKRLHAKLSVGIGGHVSKGRDASVLHAFETELAEELPGACGCGWNLVGAINDDSNEVGRVHLGAVICVKADCSMDITSPDPALIKPHWMQFSELVENVGSFENWSQILIREHLLA